MSLNKVSVRIWLFARSFAYQVAELLTIFEEYEQNEMMAFTPKQLV